VAKLESGKFQVMKKPTDIPGLVQMKAAAFKSQADETHITIDTKTSADIPKDVLVDEK